MKKYISTFVMSSILLASCSLDQDPISDYSQANVGENTGSTSFTTKAEMQAAYDNMYTYIKNSGQTFWGLDFEVNTETRSDNAYAGTTDFPIAAIERNIQDPSNSNITRDWKGYLAGVSRANVVIANVDSVPDATLTDAERKQWKAEAQILRAWMYYDMVRFWGEVPLLPAVNVPSIASFEEVTALLYRERNSVQDVYADIIKNLEEALPYAPAVNSGNKFLLSRAVANALLAKVYAEIPVRNYAKTIAHCDAVIADGFSLLPDYADLFQLNDAKTDVKVRNSVESIFEISYQGAYMWVGTILGKNYLNANDKITWARWVAPSRDLIAAFDSENDNIRKSQAIVYESVGYEHYYDANNYPFVYKLRSNLNSIIKLRLADILLLKAEALVATGNLTDAATLVNQVRTRVNLPALASSVTSSADAMEAAVLKERRLELAFEGHRWFDLLRSGKLVETMNTLNARDAKRLPMKTFTEQTTLYPVPQSEIESNPKLTQNPGY
ncbi:MAG: RagB/SusD family nutrient uptake outer membrane protein [Capnocytophaga sp.]|nr:RagB/SusD family nutrient uptake outer membrane protein [Capnocytophaga sp.]